MNGSILKWWNIELVLLNKVFILNNLIKFFICFKKLFIVLFFLMNKERWNNLVFWVIIGKVFFFEKISLNCLFLLLVWWWCFNENINL